MGERRGTKALELWCRRITEGYPGVSVQNMTTSWRDGLAFCAMIHHFRPDLIDFDNLDKNDVYGNNELAFRIAEQHLGIPALLDAEDMVTYSVPDRLSILTYLSQFYQTLGGSSPVSRTTDTIEEKITQVPESSTEKEASYPGMRKDSCAVCKLPIFLAEKLVLAHVAYHRTCFRCARCNNQLTLGNYYETEEGQYCCETCPDEEISSPTIQNWNESATFTPTIKTDKPFIRDEENMNKGISIHSDPIQHLDHKASFTSTLTAQTSRLQLNFISNQLLAEQDEQIFAVDNSVVNEDPNGFEEDRINLKIESTNSMFLVDHECEKQKEKETEHDLLATFLESKSRKRKSAIEEEITKNLVSTKDYAHDQLNMRREELKADSFHDKLIKNEPVFHNSTKTLLNQIDGHTRADSSSSLVQERRKIFENKEDYVEKNKNGNQNAEILKLKMRNDITENTENSITNSGRTETTVIDQETALKSNFGNSAADSFLIHTAPCAVSLSDTCKVSSKNSMVIVSGEESGEYQACTTFVNGINTPNITTDLNEEYPEDLNPFKNDEEEVADKSVIITNSLRTTIDLTNPFENEEELAEKNETSLPKPATRNKLNNIKANEEFVAEKPIKRRLTAPKINLNPFWSDEDDHDSDLESKEKASEIMPVPKPRTRMCIQRISSDESKLDQNHDQLHVSNDSLRSPDSRISVGGTYKKKKPAPLPPNKKDLPDQRHTSLIPKSQCDSTGFHDSSSPNPSVPKTRKTKPAPPPPPALIPTTSNLKQSSKCETHSSDKKINSWEDQKTNKDEANRNRKSFTHVPCEENFHRKTYVDKSVDGKWKRKKGPVPPCPIPHKRKIKVMSLKDVKLELDEIELQQQGLEKQGVRLEQLIRNKCESRFRTNDICLGTDVEELVLELFALVNEKNELFRRQAELMLLRRQQRLEEEHAEIEYQIRCLMSQHDSTKTDFDKQREEALIQRLVEIVEKRNEIVDCLEMDRRREIEEDRSIHRHMDLFAAKNKNESSSNTVDTAETKKQKQNKLKEKTREKKLKKTFKKDIDKDVDEIELTLKRHNKRKWF